MKAKLLFCLVLACLLATTLGAETKKRKVKKTAKVVKPKTEALPEQSVEEEVAETKLESLERDVPLAIELCSKLRCGAGKECRVNSDGVAACQCIESCQEESDPRRMVCSNHNETWNSDCELHRMRCKCVSGSEECTNERYKHVHVEYYGECRQISECTPEEMIDFPRRMRDWLFNVMRDMADRRELNKYYLKMEREAEKDVSRKWANAAVWKFCELDASHDRKVSRHELFPIRAPLMALEHCIAPFLNSCDIDDDHFISLKEWGTCLQLDENELEDKCEDIRGDAENDI